MVDLGFRDVCDLPSGELHTPAEVDFFHVGEKPVVKASKGVPDAAADHEAGAAAPHNVFRSFVLAIVFFQFLEHAAAAERVAIAVYVPAGCPCVLKRRAIVV